MPISFPIHKLLVQSVDCKEWGLLKFMRHSHFMKLIVVQPFIKPASTAPKFLILNQLKRVNILMSNYFCIHFNIVLPSTSLFSKWCLPLTLRFLVNFFFMKAVLSRSLMCFVTRYPQLTPEIVTFIY